MTKFDKKDWEIHILDDRNLKIAKKFISGYIAYWKIFYICNVLPPKEGH